MGRPARYCAMDDYTARIEKDNGKWAESEVLGQYAIVKVRAEEETLESIAGEETFVSIAVSGLDDPMSSLDDEELTAIRAAVLTMGYTEDEIASSLGEMAKCTLGEVLAFCASRRAVLAYDGPSEKMVSTGEYKECRSISNVDKAVTADSASSITEEKAVTGATVTG
jgi:hypothetical protein